MQILNCITHAIPTLQFIQISQFAGGHRWAYTHVAKHVSDLGHQHDNGPHQDQIFDNPSTLCLALWTQNWIWLGGRGRIYPV